MEGANKLLEDYKFALDQSAIVALTDNAGVILSVNDAFCKISQYSREELIGNTHRIIKSGFHTQKFYDDLMNTISSGKIWKAEFKNKSKDGKFYWVLGTIIPFLNADKKPYQYLSVHFDITERKKAEELIKEKSAQFEMISNNLPDTIIYQGVYGIDGKMIYLYLSESIVQLFGKTAGEIIENPSILYNIIYEDDRQKIADADAAAFRNVSDVNLDIRYYSASGELRWVHIHSAPRKSTDREIVWDGIYTDITEHKKTEDALIEDEQMLKTIFENSPIGKQVFDKKGFLIRTNNKVSEFLGMDAKAFIGIYNIKNDPNYPKAIWKELDNEIEVKQEVEIDFDNVDFKSTRTGKGYFEANLTQISNTVSKNIGYIIQLIDVTERKQYDNKISKAIIKAQEDERYEIGGELHDNVCQILVAAQMGLGMLNKELTPVGIEKLDESKTLISTAIADLRNLSHRLAPVFHSVTNLEESFKRLIHTYHFSKHTKTSLRVEIDEAKYNISPQLQLNLYRILQEQLNNIYKYANATVIDVDLKIVNSKLRMIIMDNGIGFDMNEHNDGIGFANMKRRVEMFAGKFEILASPDNGCLIRINIPVEDV